MKNRAYLLLLIFVISILFITKTNYIYGQNTYNDNKIIFNSLIENAQKNDWQKLPINNILINSAMYFKDTPYKAATLEGQGKEICRIDLSGLDCFTLVENSISFARIIKSKKYSFDDFINDITYTRYRNGKIIDYTSRLHYSSDWIYDNIKKNVIKDITKEIGGVEHSFNVNFMSHNPQYYQALKEDSSLIPVIKKYEDEINKRKHYIIFTDNIQKSLKYIKSGDIIAIATKKAGLDYSHIGIASVDNDKKVKFFHASSKQKKVILDTELIEYLKSNSNNIGISVLRCLSE